jgi:hypothetical protein
MTTTYEFPLPDWAEEYNHQREPIVGAQLFTKDSARTGNARVEDVQWNEKLGDLFHIRTDRGNFFKYTVAELQEHFTIGPYIMKDSELTARKIVLHSCSGCPHRDHKGAFGNPAHVPVCRLANETLPYTTTVGESGRVHAIATEVIPSWCPLEHN